MYDNKTPRELFVQDERGEDTDVVCATLILANDAIARRVISAKVDDPDGRSPWLWVRLASGDLLLGTFPCGDTYSDTERDTNMV